MSQEPTPAWEALTRQFYEWEIRGRGWSVWGAPVALEPPFRPFFGHHLVSPSSVSDDGRKPTLLSSFFDRLKPKTAPLVEPPATDLEPPPHFFEGTNRLVEIQVALPAETKTTNPAAGQFLVSLGHVSRPVSFEIVGTSDATIVQIACAEDDRRQVREQLQAYFPDAILSERTDYVRSLWHDPGRRESVVVDFGLSKEFMRPLRLFERF